MTFGVTVKFCEENNGKPKGNGGEYVRTPETAENEKNARFVVLGRTT